MLTVVMLKINFDITTLIFTGIFGMVLDFLRLIGVAGGLPGANVHCLPPCFRQLGASTARDGQRVEEIKQTSAGGAPNHPSTVPATEPKRRLNSRN